MEHGERTEVTATAMALDLPGVGTVYGDLVVPDGVRSIVLFAHGSGSSRHSPRNRQVARALQRRGHATMLMDLLTTSEEREDAATGHLRFDIGVLAERLELASGWLADEPSTARLPLGYFGASTGAAAALVAAARAPERVAAVVSRGGRPDLAGAALLSQVQTPTLLVVGELDHQVLDLNNAAMQQLSCRRDLQVVSGATHLFEEPGKLDDVARLAGDWFDTYLVSS